MHWDGAQWSLVPAPIPGAGNFLFGVSAAATDDVWATGDYFDSGGSGYGLAMRWDGTQWSITPTPSIWLLELLRAVAAIPGPSSDVWAAGEYQQGGFGPFYTL